jgi:c-di-GMP-binding flagellar brake protein YcgR
MKKSKEQFPFKERRKQPRKQFINSVTIYVENQSCRGVIQNISMGGVYIESAGKFSVGQEISISYLKSKNSDEINAKGIVVRTDQKGFALKF